MSRPDGAGGDGAGGTGAGGDGAGGMRLADRTWPEVDGTALLVVPLGSTEQHGPHLPLSTDTDVAVALADRLAERVPGVLVAPAVAYGASGEHAGFPGTLSIGQAALELLLVELVRSADLVARRVLLLNAHGGNTGPVQRALSLLRAEGRDVLAWSPRWGGDAHSGRTETAVQLALGRPVRLDRASAGNRGPLPDLLPALRAGGVRAVSPNGVLGDPSGASAAHGHDLIRLALEDLVATVYGWAG